MNIYDMNGSTVFTKFISNEDEIIDLSQLSTGIYYAEILGKIKTSVVKIVKQ